MLLRADMDALPILEATRRRARLADAGRRCTPAVTTATRRCCSAPPSISPRRRDFDGTLVFCFQPAEEGGAGAQAMIEDGLFERFPVKGVYGLHNWPGLPVGKFAVARGPAMASADRLDIVVQGYGGHAAMPHLARDPIVAAAEIVLAAQTIVSRVVDPLEPAVVSITSIHAGEAYNIIPDKVEMRSDFRTLSDAVAEQIETEMRRICDGVAAAHDMTRRDQAVADTQALSDDGQPSRGDRHRGRRRCARWRARTTCSTICKPVMGSEDFSFMLKRVPGAYVFIGNGDTRAGASPAYDFNDEAIPYGVAYWSELARRALRGRLTRPTRGRPWRRL